MPLFQQRDTPPSHRWRDERLPVPASRGDGHELPRMRNSLWVGVVFGLCACAPFETVRGDLCNDPTQNYTAEFAYECNHR